MMKAQEENNNDTVDFFGFWNICLFLSNVFNLFSNLLIFFNVLTENLELKSVDNVIAFMLSFACALSWINLLWLLTLYNNFNIVNKTLTNAAPGIFWFLLGIAPIFLAFVFSGYCLYHQNERFSTFYRSYLSLMCLFAADEYQDFYGDTDPYPLNKLFFTLYGVVILIIIANVFIFIIESGYEKEVRDSEKREQKAKEIEAKRSSVNNMKKLMLQGVSNKMQDNVTEKCLGGESEEVKAEKEKMRNAISESLFEIKDEMRNAFLNNMDEGVEDLFTKIDIINELFNEIEDTIIDLINEPIGKFG